MARVLIDMLPGDDEASARAEAERIHDPRVTAFHDPEQRLGRAMASLLGWERPVAWDIFLVYGATASWTAEGAPAPDEWFHQLNDGKPPEDATEGDKPAEATGEVSEPDPARFRAGDDLRSALVAALHAATSTPEHR